MLRLWHPAGPDAARLEVCEAPTGRDTPLDVAVIVAPTLLDTPLAVAVIAPAARAGGARLRATVAEAAGRLAPDGIAWVVVGRRRRGAGERALRRTGLVVVDRVLMVPRWPATAHLVALTPDALRDAGVRHLGLSPRQARGLARLCRGRAGRLVLSRIVRGCGVVAARPEAAAGRLRWLGAIDGSAVATATLSAGQRPDAPVAVALRFPPASAAPDLAVKIALDAAGAARVGAERAALDELAAAAAGAGAAVPALRRVPAATATGTTTTGTTTTGTTTTGTTTTGTTTTGTTTTGTTTTGTTTTGTTATGTTATGTTAASTTMLVTSALPGSPASALLRRAPGRLAAVLDAVADWLLAWNRSTARSAPATAALLERRLLGPAARIAAASPATAHLAESMRALAARLEGTPLVTVAVHDDLTMSNVLVGPGGLGVVDWEVARADGLPLLDLWYALADGVARARRVSHARAVELLRGGGEQLPHGLAGWPAAHAAALGVSADQALLGFCACWLGHADDELRRGTPGPFLAVVEAIAAQERRP